MTFSGARLFGVSAVARTRTLEFAGIQNPYSQHLCNMHSILLGRSGALAVTLMVLSLLPASSGIAQTSYSSLVLSHNPVAYWRLSEKTGSIAFDRMGAHHATYLYGVLLGQPGRYTGDFAADFNGTSGKADRAFHAALNPAGSFSLVLWCKVQGGSGTYRSPATCRMGGGAVSRGGYFLYAGSDNKWQFWTGSDTGWPILSGPTVTQGSWTHLAATFSAQSTNANGIITGNKALYVNGVLSASGSQTYKPNNTNPFRIGAGATESSGDFYFNGPVDEVAFFTKALSAAEVAALYNAAPAPVAGVRILHWKEIK